MPAFTGRRELAMKVDKPAKQRSGGAARLAGAGAELAATVIGACLLGYWIDTKLDSSPWGLVGCACVGIVGGLYNLIRRSVPGVFVPRRRDRGAGGDEGGDQTGD